jgi:hypothetical protein
VGVPDRAQPLLATFDLPLSGVVVRMSEMACREPGWADATAGELHRHHVLNLLVTDGAHTATTLSQRLPVTRQAVANTSACWTGPGLVRVTPAGREKCYEVDQS